MRKKFDVEWKHAIDAVLDEDDAATLTAVIRDYQYNNIEPSRFESPVAEALFVVIKPVIDRRARAAASQRRHRERMRRKAMPEAVTEICEPVSAAGSDSSMELLREEIREMSAVVEQSIEPDTKLPEGEKPLSRSERRKERRRRKRERIKARRDARRRDAGV